jgi:hypothetical protein
MSVRAPDRSLDGPLSLTVTFTVSCATSRARQCQHLSCHVHACYASTLLLSYLQTSKFILKFEICYLANVLPIVFFFPLKRKPNKNHYVDSTSFVFIAFLNKEKTLLKTFRNSTKCQGNISGGGGNFFFFKYLLELEIKPRASCMVGMYFLSHTCLAPNVFLKGYSSYLLIRRGSVSHLCSEGWTHRIRQKYLDNYKNGGLLWSR